MHADEIVVIHAGWVTERGTHSQLLARDGRYAAQWRVQTGALAQGEVEA